MVARQPHAGIELVGQNRSALGRSLGRDSQGLCACLAERSALARTLNPFTLSAEESAFYRCATIAPKITPRAPHPGFLSLQVLEGPTDTVYGIAWSHDGRTLASTASDRSVRLWDGASGALLKVGISARTAP